MIVMGSLLGIAGGSWMLATAGFFHAGLRGNWIIASLLWRPFVFGGVLVVLLATTTLVCFVLGVR